MIGFFGKAFREFVEKCSCLFDLLKKDELSHGQIIVVQA